MTAWAEQGQPYRPRVGEPSDADAVRLRRVNRRQAQEVSGGLADLYVASHETSPRETYRAAGRRDFLNRFTGDIRRPGFAEETGEPTGGPVPDRGFEDLGGYRPEIDQATGILTVQLGVGIDEAFVRLRAYSYTQGRRLAEVAADAVAHRLRFSADAEPRRTDEET